jgi:hypothetical protein
MPAPVRIKVYGLISLTRRGYLMCLAAGLVLLVILLLLWALVMTEPLGLHQSEETTFGQVLWTFLRQNLPWILLLAALLEALEALVVLRRFRRAVAERSAGAESLCEKGDRPLEAREVSPLDPNNKGN